MLGTALGVKLPSCKKMGSKRVGGGVWLCVLQDTNTASNLPVPNSLLKGCPSLVCNSIWHGLQIVTKWNPRLFILITNVHFSYKWNIIHTLFPNVLVTLIINQSDLFDLYFNRFNCCTQVWNPTYIYMLLPSSSRCIRLMLKKSLSQFAQLIEQN